MLKIWADGIRGFPFHPLPKGSRVGTYLQKAKKEQKM